MLATRAIVPVPAGGENLPIPMAVFQYSLRDPLPEVCQRGAVTLGNFDGVHGGHRALLAQTVAHARQFDGPAIAVTFDPPPAQILRPQWFQPFLTPLPYRCELLHAAGASHVVVMKTDVELLQLEAREFFDAILRDGFRARAIVEGFNFAFGHDRTGTGELLQTWGRDAGMTVSLLDAQLAEGQPISSSRVRALVIAGDLPAAAQLLGRPYRLFGAVGLGKQRGRTLGFPTANLVTIDNLAPGPGVYAATVTHQGTMYLAAAHVGPRPTFGDSTPIIEIHLLDFSGDLYNQPLAVDFHEKVREPRSFTSASELVDQIAIDIARIRSALSRNQPLGG